MNMRDFARRASIAGLAAVAVALFAVERGHGQEAGAPMTEPPKAPARPPKALKKTKLLSSAEKNATRHDLTLVVGHTFTTEIAFQVCTPLDKCLLVANGQLLGVEYAEQKKQLVFTPAKKGETTVTVRDDKGDIRVIFDVMVTDQNLDRRISELKELLRDIEGVDMHIMGDKIVVDGEVVVISDLSRLYAVLSDPSYKDLVLNLVGVSPVGMHIMAKKIEAEINESEVKVRVLNGYFVLEGRVENADKKTSAYSIARSMLQGIVLPSYNADVRSPIDLKAAVVKDPVIDRIQVAAAKPKPAEKMIRITLDFVELSKDYMRNFGFSWIPSLDTGGSISFGQSTTGGVTSQSNGSFSGTIGNLFPKLASAQEAGYARVLEESILVVKNGEQAYFKRQFGFPLLTVNPQGQQDYKIQKLGPVIKTTPKIVGQSEEIDLKIDFTNSGNAGKAGNAMITLDHEYNTSVTVKSGESAAIVNAMSNIISTTFNKEKPGSTSPANPLFTLLRSKAFQKSKSQFVVFVTPQILENAPSGTEDIKQKYGMKKKAQ